MTKLSIYDKVTKTILDQLESASSKDWHKPWFSIGYDPQNIDGVSYRGINSLLLGLNDYEKNIYGTYKAWEKKGLQVQRGQKANSVVFWKFSKYENAEGEEKQSAICRGYNVFNVDQVDGENKADFLASTVKELKDHEKHEKSESIIGDYLGRVKIPVVSSDMACIVASLSGGVKRIQMPDMGQFNNPDRYYATFFHEMVHSTGHRLDRDMSGGFGSSKYAFEELVAEFGSAMLCAKSGIDNLPREDHAQYISSWISLLKNDKKLAMQAASKAQKAVDMILNVKPNKAE